MIKRSVSTFFGIQRSNQGLSEALASIGGISFTFDVLDKYASGMTFDQAFEKVYGISWANAKPILARTISKQFLEAR